MSQKKQTSKKRKSKSQQKQAKHLKQSFQLTTTQQYAISLGIILLLVLIYFAPLVFQNKVPPSTDIISWKGNAKSILDAREKYDYIPLWANNVFSGMPAHLISLKPPFEQPARYIIVWLSQAVQWQTVYYLLGAVGILLLMRFWNFSLIIGTFSALAFIWWPNFIGLIEAGHNSKVMTIMLMPLVLYTFLRLLKKGNLLNFSLFTIAFSLSVRAGHYQIVFYTGLVMLFFGVVELVQWIKNKDWKPVGARGGLILLGLALGVGMSSFNAIQVREYSQYTIRGGTGEKESTGLDFDYATQWSLHPAEMYNFIIPRFFGGHSSQLYQGDDAEQLKGRVIPGYWGHMPFTSTTDYMGVVTLMLAFIGIGFQWKRREVKILSVLIVFSLLLAWGRHFPPLYKFFLNYVPFFDKFRVPTMIVVVVFFSFALLAGIGLHFLINRTKEIERAKLVRGLLIIFGIFAALGLAPFVFRNALPLVKPQEVQQYNDNILNLLKTARFDLLKGDAVRMLGLVAVTFIVVMAFLKNWLSKTLFIGAITILLLFDLFGIDKRYMQDLVNEKRMDNYFVKTKIDQIIQQDEEMHRIMPIGELSGQAHWPYFHQSITGYHPAKLRIYQDLRESCLYQRTAPGFQNSEGTPINWNVVNMLNGKYVLAKGRIQHPNLTLVYEDEGQEIVVYENNAVLPRLWCVGNIEIIQDRDRRLSRLNDPAFNPAETAILQQELDESIAKPDSCDWQLTRYEPNYIDIELFTDTQTLMVLSEIYYPAGWKAFVDGKKSEIVNVNHVLRGVVVPEGEHTISFELEPKTFKISMAVTGGTTAVVYLLLIIALVPRIRRKTKSA